MASTLKFPRGDGITHFCTIDAALWSAGGTLFFAAKPAIDDDLTDSAAAIQGTFTDDDLTDDVTIDGTLYKRYTCHFPPSATTGIVSNGAKSAKYLGEFEFVPLSGEPKTYPEDNKKIPVVVYFDVKRGTV